MYVCLLSLSRARALSLSLARALSLSQEWIQQDTTTSWNVGAYACCPASVSLVLMMHRCTYVYT